MKKKIIEIMTAVGSEAVKFAFILAGVAVLFVPYFLVVWELLKSGGHELGQLAENVATLHSANSVSQAVQGLSAYVTSRISSASIIVSTANLAGVMLAFFLVLLASKAYKHRVQWLDNSWASGSLVDLSFTDDQWVGLVRFRRTHKCAWIPLRELSVPLSRLALHELAGSFKTGLLIGLVPLYIISASALITASSSLPALVSRGMHEVVEQARLNATTYEEQLQLDVARATLEDLGDYPGLLYAWLVLAGSLVATAMAYPMRRPRFGTLVIKYREEGSWSVTGQEGTLSYDNDLGWFFEWVDPPTLKWEDLLFVVRSDHVIPVADAVPLREPFRPGT